MFNQKVNHFTSENPDYLKHSLAGPYIRANDIHNCGTTIQKYKKTEKCGSLPLQSWCSPNVAVESFGMRPIVNSKEYFENIKKYLANLVYTDSIPLKASGLSNEQYKPVNDLNEPGNSLIQALELNVTDRLIFLMGETSDKIDMFKNNNPICEGFIINDIDIQTYQSTTSKNHFLHNIVFAAVNTTRYNTVSFKTTIYQDSTPMMNNWNKAISEVENSKDLTKNLTNAKSNIYIAFIDLLNNTSCVTGQESACEYRGYDFKLLNGSTDNLINQSNFSEVKDVSWLNYPGLGDTSYDRNGNYDENGNLKITDSGPSNFNDLLKSFLN